jgi:hypothetical protein
LADEIQATVNNLNVAGYWVFLRINFLGRQLRFGGNGFWKLSKISP